MIIVIIMIALTILYKSKTSCFIPWFMKCECMDKFFSIKLEENICLKSHTATVMGFMCASPTRTTRMTNVIMIDSMLCGLPPIYNNIVIGYAMQGESFTFHGLRTHLRTMKVDPIAREIVNPEKVYLLYKL
jgi:hypothetical protein